MKRMGWALAALLVAATGAGAQTVGLEEGDRLLDPAGASPMFPGGAQEGPGQLDFFIGEWEAVSYGPNGQIVGKSRGGARWILDGTLQRHDYLGLDPNGSVVFRGTSLRTYVPDTGKWVVHWVMSNTPGYTYIDSEWVDGELHGTGYGFDGGGEFRERYRYWDITDTAYSFQLERSYDGGATWLTYPLTKATKVADEAQSMN